MEEYYFGNRANVHRGSYALGEGATALYESAREEVATFINASAGEIIFTAGATAGTNMLAGMLEKSILQKGDSVAIGIGEHHSTLLPFRELAKRAGATVEYITLDKDFHIESGSLEKLLPKTKIIALSLASNVTGVIYDLAPVVAKARSLGALVVVDGTAGLGHMSVDVRALDIDFLFFSGHKMCGPTGIGVLYGKREHLEKLEPSVFGGGIVEDVTLEETTYRKAPARFEAGTPNIAGAIGLAEAIRYLNSIGVENIKTHVEGLVAKAQEKLSGVSGVTLFAEKDATKNIGIISFTLAGVHPHDVSAILSGEGVSVRAGHHCAKPLLKTMNVEALNRASFYLYNTEEDIDALVSGLAKVKKVFNV